MPRAIWPLERDRPVVEILLADANSNVTAARRLIADTGAGTGQSAFEVILREADCNTYGAYVFQQVRLSGAYSGKYPLFAVRIQIPVLGLDTFVRAVAAPIAASALDGFACFRFLNRFTYGNFGRVDQFGLEI